MPYIMKYPNNSYVGFDDASGGYPYETGWMGCHVWNSLEEAKNYQKIFQKENFKIYVVSSNPIVCREYHE